LLKKIQGTLMASSCVTMLIGATGLVGIMTKVCLRNFLVFTK